MYIYIYMYMHRYTCIYTSFHFGIIVFAPFEHPDGLLSRTFDEQMQKIKAQLSRRVPELPELKKASKNNEYY